MSVKRILMYTEDLRRRPPKRYVKEEGRICDRRVVFQNFGLRYGDRLHVRVFERRRLIWKGNVTVMEEYPFHILVDLGLYRSSINKVDLLTGNVQLKPVKAGRRRRSSVTAA